MGLLIEDTLEMLGKRSQAWIENISFGQKGLLVESRITRNKLFRTQKGSPDHH